MSRHQRAPKRLNARKRALAGEAADCLRRNYRPEFEELLFQCRYATLAQLGRVKSDDALIAIATEICQAKTSNRAAVQIIRQQIKADRHRRASSRLERARIECGQAGSIVENLLDFLTGARPIFIEATGIARKFREWTEMHGNAMYSDSEIAHSLGVLERERLIVSWVTTKTQYNNTVSIRSWLLSAEGADLLGVMLSDEPSFRTPRAGQASSLVPDGKFSGLRWVPKNVGRRPIVSPSVPQPRSGDRSNGEAVDPNSCHVDESCGRRLAGRTEPRHSVISILDRLVAFENEIERHHSKEPKPREIPCTPAPDRSPKPTMLIGATFPGWRFAIEGTAGLCEVCLGRPLGSAEVCLACLRSGSDTPTPNSAPNEKQPLKTGHRPAATNPQRRIAHEPRRKREMPQP